jgi:hypothetical protein
MKPAAIVYFALLALVFVWGSYVGNQWLINDAALVGGSSAFFALLWQGDPRASG